MLGSGGGVVFLAVGQANSVWGAPPLLCGELLGNLEAVASPQGKLRLPRQYSLGSDSTGKPRGGVTEAAWISALSKDWKPVDGGASMVEADRICVGGGFFLLVLAALQPADLLGELREGKTGRRLGGVGRETGSHWLIHSGARELWCVCVVGDRGGYRRTFVTTGSPRDLRMKGNKLGKKRSPDRDPTAKAASSTSGK
uniref:Uncharacterized protein n=1 Tax=Oryza glumipatula TaxID=40148 RepID=A0A0E0A239_9ORYZ